MLVLPLEEARRYVYRLGARTRLGRACVRDRSARLALLAALHVLAALGLAVVAPVWLVLAGPLLLGVPHVIADVRYLVVRPAAGAARGTILAILAPLAVLTTLRLALLAGEPARPDLEILCGSSAVLLAALLAPGRARRRIAVLAALVPGAILAGSTDPERLALWLGHLHNGIAFGLWLALAWGEGPSWRLAGVAALFVGAVALLATGVLEPVSAAFGAHQASVAGLDLEILRRSLAPGLDPALGTRLVLVFVFAQSVHYAVWLRLIPGRLSNRGAPPSFRRSLDALRRDLGTPAAVAAIALSLAVPALALADPLGVRSAYLSLVLFHGWLEIATAALLTVSGRGILVR